MVMKILFVCAHNRFRSKVAEALFLKLNKSKKVEVKGAGVALYVLNQYIAPNVLEVLREKGINKIDEQSHPITDEGVEWADKIIVVADNIQHELLPEEKTEYWKISDCAQDDLEGIRERVEQIEVKVKELIKKLNL